MDFTVDVSAPEIVSLEVVNPSATVVKVVNPAIAAVSDRMVYGPAGPKGDTGEKGDKGDTGEKGDKGDTGDFEHDHDDRYYTESEVDTALSGKADTTHQHPVTDLDTSGTRDDTTYLRGDGAWATPAGGGTVGLGVGPGRRFQLMRSSNGSRLFGTIQGTEYAIGISLPDLAIAAVAHHINAVAEGIRFRVGLRPVNGIEIGAPVLDAEFDASLSGMQEVAVDATIPAGTYALTWVRYGDDEGVMRSQRSQYEQNPHLWPLSSSIGWVATGHGPVHALINTGISGPLPTTVSVQNVGTNQEGGAVPQIQVRLAT